MKDFSKAKIVSIFVVLFIFLYVASVVITYNITDRNFINIDSRFKVSTILNQGETNLTNEEKGSILVQSIYNQLDRELGSTLGWTVNDVSISKYFDNRENRQKGILFAFLV